MFEPPYTTGRTATSPEALLADLNPAQREAVIHPGGPLLVVAGAGTGKTRVLTRRVAWLIHSGVPPRAILAITFTNKAAQVLRRRLGDLPGGDGVWAGTFHGFGAWLLRGHGDRIGISEDFTILDREDQRRLLRDLLRDMDLHGGLLRPADLGAMISHVKNGGGGRAPLDLSSPDIAEAFDRILMRYRERLAAAHLLDFDDLLVEALRLLETSDEAASWATLRFTHVLVDEYQDTNRVQAALLARLLGPERNLTVVGDPDQSIYRWRGAAVRNILDFAEEFPGARTTMLERNYRSTSRILEAAEHVIEKNQERHAKRLFTERDPGERILVIRSSDADDEASVVAGQIARWIDQGIAPADIAVFYRVNALSRSVEMALHSRSIPYVLVAGVEFFHRREVKDLLAYARLVENPQDDAAFLRIVNLPRRGIGDTSLQRLRRAAMDRGVSCAEAAHDPPESIRGRARKGLAAFVAFLDEMAQEPRAPVGPLLERLAEASGYRHHLEQVADEIERSRVENLDELIAFAREFDAQVPEATLRAFLERVALVSDQDAYEEGSGRVTLMSVHAAKGLEFPCVVIVGAEDDYFPHARSADDPSALEEERRLFYVAMTRAQDRLLVTHAARRFGFRGEERRRATPYLADVPTELLDEQDRGGWPGTLPMRPGSGAAVSPPEDPPIVRDAGSAMAAGDRVRHPYFGEGRLVDLQGSGPETRATIDFEAFGRKQLLLTYARLERCP